MSPRIVAVTGALVTVLALPAAAHAAQLDNPLRPCYATTQVLDAQGLLQEVSEPINITASGFTPNSLVDIAIDGNLIAPNVATDASGAIGALSPTQLTAPFMATGQREFTVTITEQGNPANVITATAHSTALGVTVKPQATKPFKQVRWKGRGFTADKPIYAHWVYKGKVRKTIRMSRNPGLCGTFERKTPQIPVDSPGLGRWTVQFDQAKRFKASPNTTFVRLTIVISRQFG
jgi:hypothetical protein